MTRLESHLHYGSSDLPISQTTGTVSNNIQVHSCKKYCLSLSPYLVVLIFGLILSTWLTWIGVPCITSDHAVYHSPAVELVTHGRLALPCFGTLMPQTEVAFGCYPPLFQLILSGCVFSGWILASHRSGHEFYHPHSQCSGHHEVDSTHVGTNDLSHSVAHSFLFSVGVIHVTNLTHFDRQEEAAFLWLWLEMLYIQGPGLWRAMLSGLMIGLAAVTSPWIGLLGAPVLAFRTLFFCLQNAATKRDWWKAGVHLIAAAVVSALPMAGWAIYMEVNYPGIINDQFFGTMRYLAAHRPHVPSITTNIAQFYNSLLYTKPQVPIFLFTLALLPCYHWRQLSPNTLAIYYASLLALALLICVRSEASTYLGAIQILLLPCFIPALSRYITGPGTAIRFGLLLLVLFTLFACQQAVQLASLPWRWDPAERHDEVYRRLREIIPPGDLVDITGRHWDCFQGRNPWYEAYFLKDEPVLLQAKWMVITVGIGVPPCIDAFELIEQVPSNVVTEQTYAYSLWRRRGK